MWNAAGLLEAGGHLDTLRERLCVHIGDAELAVVFDEDEIDVREHGDPHRSCSSTKVEKRTAACRYVGFFTFPW